MKLKIFSNLSVKIAFVLFVVLLSIIYLPAQTNKIRKTVKSKVSEQKERIKIEPTKPAVYIDFIKFSKGKPIYGDDSSELVYLKLINNSKWSIYVGEFLDRDSESKTGLFYEVERESYRCPSCDLLTFYEENQPLPKSIQRGGLGSPDAELKSGKSVIFAVSRNHLRENLKIRINFYYDWDISNEDPYPVPQMSVFFLSSSLNKFLEEKKIVR